MLLSVQFMDVAVRLMSLYQQFKNGQLKIKGKEFIEEDESKIDFKGFDLIKIL